MTYVKNQGLWIVPSSIFYLKFMSIRNSLNEFIEYRATVERREVEPNSTEILRAVT